MTHNRWMAKDVRALGWFGLIAFASLMEGHALAECTTDICAGDGCIIDGQHVIDDFCVLDFGTKAVTIAGVLQAEEDGSFDILAADLLVTGTLTTVGGGITIRTTGDFAMAGRGRIVTDDGSWTGGDIDIWAANGTAVIDGHSITADGESGGAITIVAGTLRVSAPIHADGDMGEVTLFAMRDAEIAAPVSALGEAPDALGGDVLVVAGRALTIDSTIDVTAGNTGLFDGTITVGPACTVRLAGTLRSRNANVGGGTNRVIYRGSLDATGASMLADPDGANVIACRCVDTAPADGKCDAPLRCESEPVLDGLTCDPGERVEPAWYPACQVCANGVVEPGEECDDGNLTDCDGCSHLCRLQGDGAACDDGDRCTRVDACQSGGCVGADPVACAALDQCHEAGSCVPATGLCTIPTKPDGVACDDGDRCTRVDVCRSGACVGADPVACAALDQCHEAGSCVPATGLCTTPTKPDGAACDDGDACTGPDACQSGACVSGDSIQTCANGDGCCAAGCDGALDDDCTRSVDAYMCDRATASVSAGGSTHASMAVVLEDRFGPASCLIKKESFSCNPAEVDGTRMIESAIHQTHYRLSCPTAPRPHVTVTDRLNPGSVVVQLGTRYGTLVPSGWRELGPVPPGPPQEPPLNPDPSVVDQFVCYKTVGGPRYRTNPITIAVKDALYDAASGYPGLALHKMTKVCAPATVAGADPTAPTHPGHLACYQAKLPRGASFDKTYVATSNALLGAQVLKVRATAELCVPASVTS